MIKKSASLGASVAALPEMFTTGFSMSAYNIESLDSGQTDRLLSSLSKRFNMCILAGVKASEGNNPPSCGNFAVLYDSHGNRAAVYRKMKPFSLAGEHKIITGGDSPIVFDLCGIPASVFICYDLRFPELMRSVARDVKAMFFLANWPSSRKSHWECLLRARAIENQCYVIGVNRVGQDGNGIDYSGGSMAIDPFGNIIAQAGSGEEILFADIDPTAVDKCRDEWPFLRDMA